MRFLNRKAFSIVEYAALLIIVISAFLIMKTYIQRGIHGNWGKTGQTFAFGRQYDPQNTIECGYDDTANMWYDRNCLVSYTAAACSDGSTCSKAQCGNGQPCGCNGDVNCEENIISSGVCKTSSCSGLNN